MYTKEKNITSLLDASRPLFGEFSPAQLEAATIINYDKEFSKTNKKSSDTKESPETWNHEHYFYRFLTDPHYSSQNTRSEMLREDMKHLLLEVNLAQTVTEYDYWLDIEELNLGNSSYAEDMSVLAHNFVDQLANLGFATQRGIIEYIVFEQVKNFWVDKYLELSTSKDTPHQYAPDLTNTRNKGEHLSKPNLADFPVLLVTSPPDTKEFGYHGSDSLETGNWDTKESHHTFFYVMEVVGVEWPDESADLNVNEFGSSSGEENNLVDNFVNNDGVVGNGVAMGGAAAPPPPHHTPRLPKLKIKTTQYRTWHNLNQLVALQEQFGMSFVSHDDIRVPNQLFANVVVLDKPKTNLRTIDNSTLVKKEVSPRDQQQNIKNTNRVSQIVLAESSSNLLNDSDIVSSQILHRQLQDLLYAQQETWQHQPDQAPQFDDHQQVVDESMQFFEDFYLPRALDLFDRLLPSDITHQTPAYLQAKSELDLVAEYYLRAVEKRVQELNINPKYQELQDKNLPLHKRVGKYLQNLFSFDRNNQSHQMFKSKTNSLKENDQIQIMSQKNNLDSSQTLSQKIPQLQQLLQMDIRSKIYGQELTTAETQHFNQSAGQLLQLGNFAFGSAQCLTLAPFTASISAMKNSMQMSALGGAGGSGGGISSFRRSVENLSLDNRQEFWQELEKQDYQQITFRDGKRIINYMVPAEYLGGCYLKDGVVYGPCDIPLVDDPYAFAMTQQEFDEYMQTLKHQIDGDLDNQLDEFLQDKDHNPEEKNKLKKRLKNKLNKKFKFRVGFLEVINDDTTINIGQAYLGLV